MGVDDVLPGIGDDELCRLLDWVPAPGKMDELLAYPGLWLVTGEVLARYRGRMDGVEEKLALFVKGKDDQFVLEPWLQEVMWFCLGLVVGAVHKEVRSRGLAPQSARSSSE
jgi:hypothetical protein